MDHTRANDPSATTRRTWLLGDDGSPAAHHAIRWAAAQAGGRADLLRVANIWSLPIAPAVPPVGPMTKYWDTDVFEEGARAEVDALAGEVRELAGEGVDVETLVERGQAAAHLLGESDGADLLVVGSRGRGGFARLVLGSTSTQCANHATAPTAVIRESAALTPVTHLVVAFDGSTNSIEALRWALGFAAPGSHVDVVEVWEPIVIPMGADQMVFADAIEGARARFEEQTAEVIAAADPTSHDVEVNCDFVEGRVRHVLAERAGDADLLVMGARSGGVVGAALLGSVSGWLLHHVERPVVVVPHLGDAASEAASVDAGSS